MLLQLSSVFWYCAQHGTNHVLLQFALLHIEYKQDLAVGDAGDPTAILMANHSNLVNQWAPLSRLAGSPCFGIVNIGCMLW